MNDTLDDNLLEGFLTKEDPTQEYKLAPSIDDIKEQYSDASMDSLLHDLQDAKIMNIKEVIVDIEGLISERQTLQHEVFGDVDKIMMGMDNFLTQAGDKIDAVKEAELREKMLDIESFKLNEKINAFRDIAALKKELRDRMHEYREQEQHQHMIGDLLGER
ncbi:hypothetical protein GF367_03195 [Candidatus Woesearchaeota archaeon]|nr:hypothetical protein [Candidatus Woesearchaeota archaeon]